jgi:hypothetical protein
MMKLEKKTYLSRNEKKLEHRMRALVILLGLEILCIIGLIVYAIIVNI